MKTHFLRWLCVLLSVVGLEAQDSVTLGGTILDQAGKVLPNATVVVKNEATNLSRTATTNSEGRFYATLLPVGTYTIEASAPGFANTIRTGQVLTSTGVDDVFITLRVASLNQAVTVEASVGLATQTAVSQASLDAHTAESIISSEFAQNFTPPVSDYAEILQMAPGTFNVAVNGPGLGDTKTFFRGFKDGFYNMTFDGIPFNDTNDPTHHTWVFFPSQWIGATDFDRSPGTAGTFGPAAFGGSINLLSREVPSAQSIRPTFAYSSFNTRFVGLDYDSGAFGGKDKKSSLSINLHQLLSDGYQTFNRQKRVGGAIKYQYKITEKTVFTLFFGDIDLWTNTPNQKGPTRAQVAQFGDNFLMNEDPKSPYYYGYNYYHIQTDFGYLGIHSELGHGWVLDDKLYTMRYWNKQNYNGTTISATSATDKLNGYNKIGNILQASKEFRLGEFRTGIWYEHAYTDRYQIPSDPRTGVNALLPNYHEKFYTHTLQPFAEYEFRVNPRLSITAGVRFARYFQDFTQFADNGKGVGNLGGAASVSHSVGYTSALPSADIRYRLRHNWSVYGQFAEGNVIPPTTVFDVKGSQVLVLPKAQLTKAYQGGSVWKVNRLTLDLDYYYIHTQNPYTSAPDVATGEPIYYLTSPTNSQGFEAEANVYIARGFSVYLNGTAGTAKYKDTGLWVANAPRNTLTGGLTYQHKNWDVGFFNKRIGQLWQDNLSINQAVAIDPFTISNLFFNYTIKGESYLRGTKIRFGINNLFDRHSIVGVTPASTATNSPQPGDQLALMAARSFSVSITPAYAPGK